MPDPLEGRGENCRWQFARQSAGVSYACYRAVAGLPKVGRAQVSCYNMFMNNIEKAKQLLLKKHPSFTGEYGIEEIEGVGYRVWQKMRGGATIIVGNDGGVLFTNMTGLVGPSEMVQAYKDGKRTDEALFEDLPAGR